jgi:hypothetical protein
MSVSINPDIITDGLVLCLDAANPSSYPESGSVWKDLVNDVQATLYNGPTYSRTNVGSLSFDGSNENCIYSLALNKSLTVITWAKSNTENWYGTSGLGSCRSQNGYILHNNENSKTIDWYIMDGAVSALYSYIGGYTLSNIQIPIMYSLTTNGTNEHKGYINQNLIFTQTGAISRSDSPAPVQTNLASDFTNSRFNNITLYSHLIYNRVLSPNEILTNYNATKGRFGL